MEGEEGEPLAGAASLEEDPSAAQPYDGEAAPEGDDADEVSAILAWYMSRTAVSRSPETEAGYSALLA